MNAARFGFIVGTAAGTALSAGLAAARATAQGTVAAAKGAAAGYAIARDLNKLSAQCAAADANVIDAQVKVL